MVFAKFGYILILLILSKIYSSLLPNQLKEIKEQELILQLCLESRE